MNIDFLLGLIPSVFVLGILIFIHELGHFIACKWVRVRVEKFSIGFGPELFHFQGRETRYAVGLIPFGGYVKPSGESHEELSKRTVQPFDFMAQNVTKRSFIVVSGVLMNYLLAYVLFSMVYFVGRPVLGTRVAAFMEGYPAGESGILIGDRIVRVDGVETRTWGEVTDKIVESPGVELVLTVERNQTLTDLKVIPKEDLAADVFGKEQRIGRIGVKPSEEFVVEKFGFLESWIRGGETLIEFTVLTFKALWLLITGQLSLKTLSGPIGIFAITSQTAQLGLVHLMQLTAFLNVSLAIFNLLPFPPLDGGFLLFLGIEAVRKRQLSLKVQEGFSRLGYLLLILLMVVVVYNDLTSLKILEKLREIFPG